MAPPFSFVSNDHLQHLLVWSKAGDPNGYRALDTLSSVFSNKIVSPFTLVDNWDYLQIMLHKIHSKEAMGTV